MSSYPARNPYRPLLMPITVYRVVPNHVAWNQPPRAPRKAK